jgi:hypothetical protein
MRGIAAFAVFLTGVADAGLPATPASAAVVPPPVGAVVVGTASATCPAPAFATITAAVVASPAGTTIYVCAGLYNENVPITKNLTLLGAQFGVDARTGRTNAAEETVVSSPTGEFTYSGAATTGIIDGFAIQGAAVPASDENGILAINAGDGYTWINNIITGNTTGINFRASGAVSTLINHNRITANTAAGSSSGNGIFFTNGPVNNVTISDNAFANNRPAINTTGVGDLAGGRSVNVTVVGNTSVDDGNFIALFLAQHVQITGNAISWTNPNDPAAGSAIFVSGGNDDVTIGNNTIDGGAASGINLNNIFYSASPSTTVRVTGNTITRRLNGVRVPAGTAGSPPVVGATISGNRISAAGVGDTVPDPSAGGNGIWIQGGSQFTVTGNTTAGSVSTDCRDQTTGGGTAGTANSWTGNTGATSFPTGLCGILVTPSITGVINATSVKVGGSLQQTVTVTGTGGQPGTLNWQLLGPVPDRHYSCAAVDFRGAPVLAAGTLPVTGDGQLTVPATVVQAAGCYTFTDALTGPSYTNSPMIAAGDPANTALASKKILPVTGPVGAARLATAGSVFIFVGSLLLWTARRRAT